MATTQAEIEAVVTDLVRQGAKARTTKKGTYVVKFPDGSQMTMSASGDRRARLNNRSAVIRAGLVWPLDPKPKARTIKAPDEPYNVVEEASMVPVEVRTPSPLDATSDVFKLVVTPEVAEQMLETMGLNRPLRANAVTRLANAMKKGDWHYDGSPIRFNRDGELIDGQHRLWAIIESETTQELLIVKNLDPAAMTTMDTGAKRTISDVLNLAMPGLPSAQLVGAITRGAMGWEAGIRGRALRSSGSSWQPSHDDMVDWVQRNRDLVVEGARVSHRLQGRTIATTATVHGVLWVVFSRLDKDDAEYFFDRLGDGVGLAAGDPILALRNVLTQPYSKSTTQRKMPSELAMALIIKAWNYYRNGRTVQQLQFRPGGSRPEAFPEPI